MFYSNSDTFDGHEKQITSLLTTGQNEGITETVIKKEIAQVETP